VEDLGFLPWGDGGCHLRVIPAEGRPNYDQTVRRRELVLDVSIATLTLGLSLGVLAAHGLGMPDPSARHLDGIGAVLALAATLPLAARRLAPLTVYLVTAAASIALVELRYPLDLPFGCVTAAYFLAVAYSGNPRPARRWAAMLAVWSFVPAAAAARAASGYGITGIAPGLGFWALIFIGAWIAGDRARLRREQITGLEERALRTEREAARERRLAAAQERTRIARELHDSAAHAINIILVQAGAARLLHQRDPGRSQHAIATIEQVARSTIGEIDGLVRALRDDPSGQSEPADPAALDELLSQHRAAGLAIATDLRGPGRPLPRSVAWATYRILQEALTNAARHGQGSADVAVWFQPHAVEIKVTNPAATNGKVSGGGHGIVGMRERAAVLGGTFEAHADDGTFSLYARLPHGQAAA
jgi:signal transduction histidine kinase